MNPTSCPICGAPQKHDHNYWRKFECGTQQKLSSKMRVVSEGCLWRVIEKREDQIEAMNAKLKALAPHGTCGCSLDKPDDVCLHHAPKITGLLEWVESELVKEVPESASEYVKGYNRGQHDVLDAVRRRLAGDDA